MTPPPERRSPSRTPPRSSPQVPNPQVADSNGCADNNNPRDPHPPRDDVDSLARQVEDGHLEKEERAGDAPDERVEHVEGRREGAVDTRGSRGLVPPDPGERPDVLQQAGDLGKDEEDEESVRAVADHVAAGDEDEERGEVVSDEEDVSGKKGEIVEQVHGEVGDAVVEDVVLEARVGRGEGAESRGQREDGSRCRERGEGPVEERDEAAGAVQTLPRRPPPEHEELADAVDGGVHNEERREQPPLLGGQRRQQLHGRAAPRDSRREGRNPPDRCESSAAGRGRLDGGVGLGAAAEAWTEGTALRLGFLWFLRLGRGEGEARGGIAEIGGEI